MYVVGNMHVASQQNTVYRIIVTIVLNPVLVGPCHHGMARPQVADGGTASDMEGSC